MVRLDDVDLLIVVAVAFGLSSASPFFGAMWILGVISVVEWRRS